MGKRLVTISNGAFVSLIYNFVKNSGGKGVARGETGEIPPPPKPKKCCRKMVLFPKALFLVTNFRKKINNKNKKE